MKGRIVMDQKNTIVKCKVHPNCLFNHNGVCDNYVININVDGKCECYIETEDIYAPPNAQEILEYTIKLEQEKLRGQRAKRDLVEDGWVNPEIVKKVCQPFTMSDHLCDIRCVSAYYAEDGELYCALIQDFPERPFRCSAYDDGGEE